MTSCYLLWCYFLCLLLLEKSISYLCTGVKTWQNWVFWHGQQPLDVWSSHLFTYFILEWCQLVSSWLHGLHDALVYVFYEAYIPFVFLHKTGRNPFPLVHFLLKIFKIFPQDSVSFALELPIHLANLCCYWLLLVPFAWHRIPGNSLLK